MNSSPCPESSLSFIDAFPSDFAHSDQKTLPIEPVVRPTVQMHRCLDYYFIGVNSIEKGIWEPVNKAPTDIRSDDWPTFRITADVLNSHVDLVEEVTAETGCLKFVILRGIEHFQFGRLKKTTGFI